MSNYLKNQIENYLSDQGFDCDVMITKGKNYSDYASNVALKYKLDEDVFKDFKDPIIKSIRFVNGYLNIEITSDLHKKAGHVEGDRSRMYQIYHRLDIEGYHEGDCPKEWYPLLKTYHLLKKEKSTYASIEEIFDTLDRACIYRHYTKSELGGLYILFHNCLLLKESKS